MKVSTPLSGPGAGLLIGVDLQKDEAVLHAAYNDSQGVTAAFNLNLLARINRELGADFDLDGFEHRACYNRARSCIEMHLISRRRQTVTLGDTHIEFQQGETLHTEDSHKYTLDSFHALAAAAGWRAAEIWTDPDDLFSVHHLVAG